MSVSELASAIVESPTLRLNEEARLLRERGEPVIHLGIGEPKNKTPITAILSSAAKLSQGDVKYCPSDGLPSLKKAIIRYTEETYDKVVAPENVIVSSGAKQALFNILYTILNPQDEVVILAPYWVSYPEMVKMVYGVPVIVTPEDGSFHPRMADIERAVSSSTKAIIVNSPNNPSGIVYPEEFIAQIVEFCERKKIYLIMDDIYHKLVFDGRTAPPCYRFTTKDVEDSRLIVINGIAKLYGMTGFRIGWCVAPRQARDGDEQRAGADDVLRLAGDAGRRGRRAAGPAERRRGAAADDPEQPRRRHARAVVVQRREDATSPTGRSTACPTSAPTAATRSSSPVSS